MKWPITWKSAVVRVSWEIIVNFPDDDTEHDVDSFLNESSACSSRYIQQLAGEEERAGEGCCFSCHRFNGKFLRWAEPHDISNLTPEAQEDVPS